MKWHQAALIACVLSTVGTGDAFAQTPAPPAPRPGPDETVRKDIEQLMELTGAQQMIVQAANLSAGQILESLRARPSIPPRAIDIAKEVLDAEFRKTVTAPDGLMANIVGVYASHFSAEDVRGLVAFYKTDVGRKLIAMMPKLLQDSMEVSQKWAERETPRILTVLEERLKKEGVILK